MVTPDDESRARYILEIARRDLPGNNEIDADRDADDDVNPSRRDDV
jgi:hypothetical protein